MSTLDVKGLEYNAMEGQRFAVVFSGRIVDGADPQRVRENLARLFKVDAAKVDLMFSGKPVLIKKDIDEAKARSYQAALWKAGAVVELVAAPAKTASDSDKAASNQAGTAEPMPTPAQAGPPVAPPPPVAPNLTIAEVGTTLVEQNVVAPVDFDTTQFDLAEVGSTLVEYETVPTPDFDTTGLELAPPGAQLVEPIQVPRAEFDTSGLSLVDNP